MHSKEEVIKILEENKITNVLKKKFKIIYTKKFYSQWYWQEALMHPYEKTKAYYHGPREEWMNLMKDEDE